MIVLGIDTATSRVSVALGDQEGCRATLSVTGPRRHAETLAPAIEACCRLAGLDLARVGAVAVDVGPGLFTGLRVGLSTAKALAVALRVGMVGMTSLDLLAYPLRHLRRLVVAAVDARRGEVFWAAYRHVPGGVQQVSGYQVSSPEHLASELAALDEECVLVGDGAERHASVLGGEHGVELGGTGLAHPTASALVELAHRRALHEELVSPERLSALYLRQPDARIHWERRQSAPAGGLDQ